MKEIQGYFDILQSKLQSCMQTQKEAIRVALQRPVVTFLQPQIQLFAAHIGAFVHLLVRHRFRREGKNLLHGVSPFQSQQS